MKKILFILTIFSANFSFAQGNLDKKFSEDVCECMNQTKQVTEYNIQSCYQIAMQQNKDHIIKEVIALYGDTSSKTAYTFGNDLYERTSVNLVYSCIKYFNLMDSLRYTAIKDVDKDSITRSIQNVNKTDPKTWNSDFFTERGLMYFQISDLKNALKDFNDAIKLDPNAFQSIYFKAWTLEINKQYDEAIDLYNNLALITKNNAIAIMSAIAKQKKKNNL